MTQSDGRIETILIVGGGTAGWLAAAYLNRALGPGVKIRLVESKIIGRIGVGEATVTTLRFTLGFLGLKDEDWMPKIGATYKSAIKFVDWNDPANPSDYFYHPFFERNENLLKPFDAPYFIELGEGISVIHYWLKQHLEGNREPFAYAAFPGPAICDRKLAPRFKGQRDYEVPTAYHVDAQRLADFLRDLAVSRGVEHVYDDVEGVQLDERGFIRSVKTKSGRELAADLFLDCTGFRGVLINQALGVPFVSERRSLLCDAAVALSAKNDPPTDGIDPFTMATAARAGWIWEIPLFHRFGCGYVYSSEHLSRDAAEQELRNHLGAKASGSEPNHIRMRTGRNERMWDKNCVSVGLSSCFIEPLESTTIFLIEYALANLVTLFPDKRFSQARIKKFNDTMTRMYGEIRDFIVLHYVLARRQDTPFWKDVRSSTLVPDSLREKLDFFKESLPMLESFTSFVFRERSYTCVLSGLGYLPEHPLPLLAHVGDREGRERIAANKARTAELVERLPTHYEYLDWMYHGGEI